MSRLSQLPSKKVKVDVSNGPASKSKDGTTKAACKQKDIPEGKVGATLDTNSYEMLDTFKGSVLVGKKCVSHKYLKKLEFRILYFFKISKIVCKYQTLQIKSTNYSRSLKEE